ncbi:MAG TPA: transglycosylase SLT domain-containing protein [Bryobacteraceae bacterium]|nr:transglycosylase SLT domain-containing protein [Bryobacteraceae bacterium]
MPSVAPTSEQSAYCLLRQHGTRAGSRHALRSPVTRLGRAADNDVVMAGPESSVVSAKHAEIREEAGQWVLRDLGSTNGTFLDGERCFEAPLALHSVIQLGTGGPTLTLTTWHDSPAPGDLSRTLVVAPDPQRSGLGTESDRVLGKAVADARHARWAGAFNQTGAIMRQALVAVMARSTRRFRLIVAGLVCLLVVITGVGAWRIQSLRNDKAAIDARIERLEQGIDSAIQDPTRMDRLILELDHYQTEAEALEHNPLYRWSGSRPPDPLDSDIRVLLAEFGAEVYSIPPEFRQAVKHALDRYQGPDRPLMARALGEAEPEIGRVGRVLERNHLPRDFAYMVLVESAMHPPQRSASGPAGLWQLTPGTARGFGLRVNGEVDQRLDLNASTEAASRYIRSLILDFGAGSSVMLALAAYDVGPARVKQAIRRVTDPIRQRDFWYLYRTHALPEETREYVPKVIAAMIVGRNPGRYGF